MFQGLPTYGDLLLDELGVKFLGPAPLDLELLHMLTTFHWNALGSTLGWWFCHNNTVSCNEQFWAEQVTIHPPPPGEGQGVGKDKGGGCIPTDVLVNQQRLPGEQKKTRCTAFPN